MSNENSTVYSKKSLPESFGKTGLLLLAIGLILVALAFFVDHTRSAFNNLIMLLLKNSGILLQTITDVNPLNDICFSEVGRSICTFLYNSVFYTLIENMGVILTIF